MKKRYLFLALAILTLALPSLEAQTKKRLAILPFSGGQAQDGETISVLLSNQRALLNAFTVQPRNSAIDRIMGEQQFQRQSGLINSDAISEIGKLNTADLVVSGHITKLGNINLVLMSIIDVSEVQQIAGVYQTYRSIEEMRRLLPDLSKRLADASQKDSQNLPGLAVPSFTVPNNVNANDAMVLAQILATEIVNLGKYAVFPRTSSVDDVLTEARFQRSGQTADTKALGTSRNIDFILASSVMSLGRMNMFGAQILNIERGDVIVGADKEYQDISDGLNKNLMRELARELASNTGSDSRQTPARRQPRAEREPKTADPDAIDAVNAAKLWTVGISAGSALAPPFLIGTVHGTIAPFRNSFLELGFDFGFVGWGDPDTDYYSMYPFAHYAFFLPFKQKGGWYIGAGAGAMIVDYTFRNLEEKYGIDEELYYWDLFFAVDFITGFNIGNFLDISYTLRTNFGGASNKISVGYTYRFK